MTAFLVADRTADAAAALHEARPGAVRVAIPRSEQSGALR